MKKFLDLGLQPLANSYILRKNLNSKEKKFRLSVGFNSKNYLVSILNTVPKEKMFNKNYPYKSSESTTMINSFKKLSISIKKKFKPKFLIEIGCNDGAFLRNFKKKDIVGVEPCKNLANLIKKKGFRVYPEYWNIKLAKKITKKRKADLIYSANTLSHIKNYSEIFRAIKGSLSRNGILILEDPSLLECIKNVAYDQFYCEHIYVFSTIALNKILQDFGLIIFDLEKTTTHGGSNRYFIKKKENNFYKVSKRVNIEIKKELRYGLKKFSTYTKFGKKVQKSKKKLTKMIKDLKKKKYKIIGYGATAKSCTVLNYCNIGKKEIDFFYDTTTYKIGKFLPGSKIKVKKYRKLDSKNIDFAYLGAWNFKDEIFKKERKFLRSGGRFITHTPFPKII